MTRRPGPSAVITCLLAAALTAWGTAGAGAADPMHRAPVVGQCFDLSPEELAQPSHPEAPVDCAAVHTSQVIAVALLPDDLTYESTGLTRFALETCYPAQRKVLGTSMRGVSLTAYSIGYFGPTPEQQAAGARWLRCDLVLGHPTTLHPLPGRLEVGTYPFSAKVSRCLAGRDFHVTVCTDKHTFRATGALKVDQERFPTEKAWIRIGNQRCRSVVSSRYFRFGWPSKVAWKAGNRTLTCYSQTRR